MIDCTESPSFCEQQQVKFSQTNQQEELMIFRYGKVLSYFSQKRNAEHNFNVEHIRAFIDELNDDWLFPMEYTPPRPEQNVTECCSAIKIEIRNRAVNRVKIYAYLQKFLF